VIGKVRFTGERDGHDVLGLVVLQRGEDCGQKRLGPPDSRIAGLRAASGAVVVGQIDTS
jgi:hypothetical protein